MGIRQRERAPAAVPLNVRLFRLDEAGRPLLIGRRCPDCGCSFFPSRVICARCSRIGLEEVELSGCGKIWSYTIAHQAPPGAVVQPPYAIAQVELPEHVLVQSLVTDCRPEDVRIDMEVEIAPVKVGQDEDGRDLVAFAFRPARSPARNDDE